MKILFLCGSLEPGRDGVGDYTLRLAGELIRQGHQVQMIALFDRYTSTHLAEDQLDEKERIPSLRFPAVYPFKQNIRAAKKRVEDFNPDWISLQFVPYSFNRRGLPFNLASELNQWVSNYKLHIMFHELWIGIKGKTKFKDKIIGFVQRSLIQRLIDQCQLCLLTTSIPLYQRALNRSDVKLLPLFGNIPIILKPTSKANSEFINVIHFGSFSSQVSLFAKQLTWISGYAESLNKKVNFILMGNGGPFKIASLEAASYILDDYSVVSKGQLSPEEISDLLMQADIGLSRADLDFFGKSGSTLTMLEHGLPVLLKQNRPVDLSTIESSFSEQLLFMNDPFSIKIKKKEPKSRLADTAFSFIEQLRNA